MLRCKRTLHADALVVELAACAFHHWLLYLYAEMLLHEVDGRQHGEVGVAFAAARATVLRHLLQCFGRAEVAEPPRVGRERSVARDDGHKDARANRRAAGTHIAAEAAGHLTAALHHLDQPRGHVDFGRVGQAVVVGCQQRGTHQHVVFGAVHVAEWLRHHLLEDFNRVARGLLHAHGNDGIHARRVAVVTDIVAFGAAGLAGFLLVADDALHHCVLLQVFERSSADETFFVCHSRFLFVFTACTANREDGSAEQQGFYDCFHII